MLKKLQTFIFIFLPLVAQWSMADTSSAVTTPKTETVKETPPAPAAPVYVTFDTSLGSFTIELLPNEAPLTVKNFLFYVDNDFYKDITFHRIIPGFVVQGGGFDKQFRRKQTAAPIVNESNNGLKNLRGTLSMARTNNPNSATSQFFINLVDNRSLDWAPGRPGYAVFAKVISGMDVVDAMTKLEQGKYMGPFINSPNEVVWIKKAIRVPKPDAKAASPAKP